MNLICFSAEEADNYDNQEKSASPFKDEPSTIPSTIKTSPISPPVSP